MSSDDLEAKLAPLWRRAQQGDEVAYRDALALIAGRLRGYYQRRLSSQPDDIEDLVQETLLAVHLKRGTHDAALPVSNWLHAIARYKLVDFWRSRGRREELFRVIDQLPEHWLVTQGDGFALQGDLQRLLATLSPAQRSAIRLIKLEGLTASEASQRSGVSVQALKVQVHRGLRRLAQLVRQST